MKKKTISIIKFPYFNYDSRLPSHVIKQVATISPYLQLSTWLKVRHEIVTHGKNWNFMVKINYLLTVASQHCRVWTISMRTIKFSNFLVFILVYSNKFIATYSKIVSLKLEVDAMYVWIIFFLSRSRLFSSAYTSRYTQVREKHVEYNKGKRLVLNIWKTSY